MHSQLFGPRSVGRSSSLDFAARPCRSGLHHRNLCRDDAGLRGDFSRRFAGGCRRGAVAGFGDSAHPGGDDGRCRGANSIRGSHNRGRLVGVGSHIGRSARRHGGLRPPRFAIRFPPRSNPRRTGLSTSSIRRGRRACRRVSCSRIHSAGRMFSAPA